MTSLVSPPSVTRAQASLLLLPESEASRLAESVAGAAAVGSTNDTAANVLSHTGTSLVIITQVGV